VAEVVAGHAADRACADHVLPVCRTERYLNLPEAGEAALDALSKDQEPGACGLRMEGP
jgi:hypothetical protein